MEDGPGQEQSRSTLSFYGDFLSALAQIGFSVVWSSKKTEKPDANALLLEPKSGHSGISSGPTDTYKTAQDAESELPETRPLSVSFELCVVSRELLRP